MSMIKRMILHSDMEMASIASTSIKYPTVGFYKHYKYDESKNKSKETITNWEYIYEVVGVGNHTEMKHSTDGSNKLVVYRPLYPEAYVYQNGKQLDVRPLNMFMEKILTGPEDSIQMIDRFTCITDPDLVYQCAVRSDELYTDDTIPFYKEYKCIDCDSTSLVVNGLCKSCLDKKLECNKQFIESLVKPREVS